MKIYSFTSHFSFGKQSYSKTHTKEKVLLLECESINNELQKSILIVNKNLEQPQL